MKSRSLSQIPTKQLLWTTENTEDRYISAIIPHIDLPEETFIHVEPASLPANVLQRKGCFINECFNMKRVCNSGSRASGSHSPSEYPHHRTNCDCSVVLPPSVPFLHNITASTRRAASDPPTSQNASLGEPSCEEGKGIRTPLGWGRHPVSHWCLITMSHPWISALGVTWKVKHLRP